MLLGKKLELSKQCFICREREKYFAYNPLNAIPEEN